MSQPSRLSALVDGAPLDDEASRTLWTEFSAHMDEHRGDMAGFAAKKGWERVAPEFHQGKAVLVVRTGAVPVAPTPRAQAKPNPPRPQGKPKPGPPRQGKSRPAPRPKRKP